MTLQCCCYSEYKEKCAKTFCIVNSCIVLPLLTLVLISVTVWDLTTGVQTVSGRCVWAGYCVWSGSVSLSLFL